MIPTELSQSAVVRRLVETLLRQHDAWHRLKRVLGVWILIWLFVAILVLSPLDVFSQTRTVDVYIGEGMSSHEIGQVLEKAGLVRDSTLFAVVSRVRGVHRQLKSGHYRFNTSQSLVALIDAMSRGEVHQVRVTIPEGYRVAQIAALLEDLGVAEAKGFEREALSSAAEYADVLGFHPPTKSLEGYLFPDTYMVSEGLPVRRLISVMLDRFREKVMPVLSSPSVPGFTIHELVTLASIIEWEAKRDSERSLISSVFHNRLARNIPLQSCATVQYALGRPKRDLTHADLAVDSPYNTYVYGGLPPGPIANPSLSSLRAAANPADTPYMYFVADGSGGHVFSIEYPEHLSAAEDLRQLRGD